MAQCRKVGLEKRPHSPAADLPPRKVSRLERQRCCSRGRLFLECFGGHEAANLEAASTQRMGAPPKRSCQPPPLRRRGALIGNVIPITRQYKRARGGVEC